MKKGPIRCPEKSLGNYHYSIRKCPRRVQLSFTLRGKPEIKHDVSIGVAELVDVTLDFVNFLTAVGTPANGSEVSWK
jgi:hypothetical protein